MKKSVFWFVPVCCALLILAGCSGGGGGNTGPSVSQVSPASLSDGLVGTADFDSTDYSGGGNVPGTETDALRALGTMMGEVIGTGVDFVDDLAFYSNLETWLDTYFSLDTVPTNLFELDGPPDYVSITGSATNTPLGIIGTLPVTDDWGLLNGSAEVTADITTNTDGMPTRVKLTFSVDDAVLDVTDIVTDTGDGYSVTVNAGKIAASMNINIDLIISWAGNDLDGYEPTSFNGAYSSSLRLKAAMSGVCSDTDFDAEGHILAELTFDDSESLYIDEALMADPDALAAYLDDRISPDNFLLSIDVYGNPVEAAVYSDLLTLDELLAIIPTA